MSESHSDITLSAREDSASEGEDSEQPLSAVDVPAIGKRKRGEDVARRQPKGSAGGAPQKPEQGPEAKTKKKKNRPGQRARRQHGALAQQGWGRVQSGLRRFQQVTWAAPSDVYLCCKENITYSPSCMGTCGMPAIKALVRWLVLSSCHASRLHRDMWWQPDIL